MYAAMVAQGTPPHVARAAVAEAARRGMNTKAVLSFPYYSTVRLKTTRSGAGPFTYTGDLAVKKAFSYKIGDVMDAAGFPAGTIATKAETNLLKASETRDNADVMIYGFSIHLRKNDPKLAYKFFRECVVELALSGTDTYQLGILDFFPQAGGLYGQQRTLLEAGQLVETSGPLTGFMSNGNPNAGSWFGLPDPLLWESVGSGKKDTSLIVSITPQRAITETSTDRAAVAGAAPGASGRVEAFTSPADAADGTFVDLTIRCHSVSISERSTNT